jgi:hypothetical protein
MVQGLGFRVQGSGSWAPGPGFRIQSSGSRGYGSGCMKHGIGLSFSMGCRVHVVQCRV